MSVTSSTSLALESNSPSFRTPVDSEHNGIRLAGCLTLVFGTIITYLVITIIVPGQTFNLVAGIVSLIVAAGLTALIDRYLKQNWPSNRSLQIENDTLATTDKQQLEREIDLTRQVNVLMWRFEVPRQTRVPKGWYVVCTTLVQEDVFIPTYTFAPPEEFKEFRFSSHYVPLKKKKDLQNERDFRLAGQHRRLHQAEEYRQLHGAEVKSEQFEQYIAFLCEHYPQWMPNE